MWRQLCWLRTLKLSEPACRPVSRLRHHPVRRQVCSLLIIAFCKRCLPNRPLSAKFLGLHLCLCVNQRIKQCFGLHFDFSLQSLICGHHSHPYLGDCISRSFSPVLRQAHCDVCNQLSRLPSIHAWLQVCWQVRRPAHALVRR